MPANEFRAIERLLKKGARTTRANKLWMRIHEETGAGLISNGSLQFTPDDLQRLRDYGRHLGHGVDPLFDSLDGGRMGVAQKAPDEKLSADSVFGDLVVLMTVGAARVVIDDRAIATPEGSVLSVRPGKLDVEQLRGSRVIVIENGSLMPFGADIMLPTEWQNSVLLYRGHRENVRAVQDLIDGQPPENLAFYYDFDPEGLEMALRARKGSVFIPADWHALRDDVDQRKEINQRDTFRRQAEAMKRMNGLAEDPTWGPVIQAMKVSELAVMQEHLTVRRYPLQSVPCPAI